MAYRKSNPPRTLTDQQVEWYARKLREQEDRWREEREAEGEEVLGST